jgi:hypothetical protein
VSAETEQIQQEFSQVQQRWRQAIDAHRLAPPDADYSARLAALATVAREEAAICRRAATRGFAWPPHSASSKPPYELRPESGRRGPAALWQRFDAAVAELERAAAGRDLVEVARAHELLADAADELAAAVEREDRASGLLPGDSARERRSA